MFWSSSQNIRKPQLHLSVSMASAVVLQGLDIGTRDMQYSTKKPQTGAKRLAVAAVLDMRCIMQQVLHHIVTVCKLELV